jgi:hypothetical protein
VPISFHAGGPARTMDRLHAHKWGPQIERLLRDDGAAAGEPAQGLALGEPYRVQYLSLANMANGDLGEAVHATQWRHLLMRADRPVAEVELNDHLAPIALHEGPAKDGLQAAIQIAEGIGGDFEASVVQSAPLKFIALLLRSGERELLIPFPPDLTDLPNYEPISVSDALKVLRPMAARVLEATSGDDALGG